MTTSTANGF